MRQAALTVYYSGSSTAQVEYFIPIQIRRLRPDADDRACEILVCDSVYPNTNDAPWVALDMSVEDARNEIDRALVEPEQVLEAAPQGDSDTDTDTGAPEDWLARR